MSEDPLDHSRETRHLLNNHIQVTKITLENLERTGKDRHDTLVASANSRHSAVLANIARLESALKWAGGIIVSLTLTVLGWALLQQFNANEAQKKDLQQQLDLLRAQQIERQSRSLAAGAAQAVNPPVSD